MLYRIKPRKLQAIQNKALRIVRFNLAFRLNPTTWIVRGNKHIRKVVIRHNQVICECKGFKERAICSHSLAVRMIAFKPKYQPRTVVEKLGEVLPRVV